MYPHDRSLTRESAHGTTPTTLVAGRDPLEAERATVSGRAVIQNLLDACPVRH